MGRIYVLSLGIAAAAGWLLGLVLLPLITWLAIEAACGVGGWIYGSGRMSNARTA